LTRPAGSRLKRHPDRKASVGKCVLAIYSSDWAAQSALKYYYVDPHKVAVVSFGANINFNRAQTDIPDMLKLKDIRIRKLLFIGGDWQRKGGGLSVQVVAVLTGGGILAFAPYLSTAIPLSLPAYKNLFPHSSFAQV
jgi:hypothetical protein